MSEQRVLWVATGNRGKLAEFKMLLKNLPFTLKAQSELPVFSPPPETGTTLLENARIKAKSLKSVVNDADWVIADDSGLFVEGLDNLPGVHSARYAGPKASAQENNAKLLKMMQIRSATNRKAYFECTLVLISPEREEHVFVGRQEGQVATKAIGTGGFGYDPVIIPTGMTKTMGELNDAEKNAISHRYKACQLLLEFFAKK
jgi:XTP/dITP diphosphohydrolase